MTTPAPNRKALDIAQQVHNIARAKQTVLCGSRARRDHRDNSGLDLLIITETAPSDS